MIRSVRGCVVRLTEDGVECDMYIPGMDYPLNILMPVEDFGFAPKWGDVFDLSVTYDSESNKTIPNIVKVPWERANDDLAAEAQRIIDTWDDPLPP